MSPTVPAGERLTPACRIKVNGTELPPQATSDLISATVQDDVGAPGVFALKLINWDVSQLKVRWVDDPLFSLGNEVSVELGYVGQLQVVISGEITGLEPEFDANEVPQVTIRGYDRRHRLLRGRKTRSFTHMKDSDIANQIAGDSGLTPQAQDTGVTLDFVMQRNQTDMEFLQERASQIGCEVAIDGSNLQFRPRQTGAGQTLTLARDKDLLEFCPRLSLMGQVGQVSIRGWDPKTKAAILSQAAAADASAMGGASTGPQLAESVFGQAVAAGVTRPVFSQSEADQVAKGWLKEVALGLITGEGVTAGRTDLRAGQVVAIQGVGTRFSGEYYVTSTTHSFSARRGYRTAFAFRRNSS